MNIAFTRSQKPFNVIILDLSLNANDFQQDLEKISSFTLIWIKNQSFCLNILI